MNSTDSESRVTQKTRMCHILSDRGGAVKILSRLGDGPSVRVGSVDIIEGSHWFGLDFGPKK